MGRLWRWFTYTVPDAKQRFAEQNYVNPKVAQIYQLAGSPIGALGYDVATVSGGDERTKQLALDLGSEAEGVMAIGGAVAAYRGVPEEPTSEVSYARPSGYRVGVRDKVWDNAVNASPDGLVRDPLTGNIMAKSEPWDMGHLPGHEFRRIQFDAETLGLSRHDFLDIHNDPLNYRPELPSSNRSHALEDMSDQF